MNNKTSKAPKVASISLIPHVDRVSEDDIKKARDEARAKIIAEQTKQALDQVKVFVEREERALMEPEFEMVTLTIDVPACSDGIRLDGVLYRHGDTITVASHVAKSMRDIIQASWFVEKLSGHPNMKNYYPPKTYELHANTVGSSGFRRV